MEHINLEYFFNLEREGKKSIFDFCIKMGFIADSYECPECKNPMKLKSYKDHGNDGFVWYCKHKNNFIKRSIRSGTWFQVSHLPLIQMLKLVYLWVKKTQHAWIADELKTSHKTVTEWMTFCRKVCVNAIMKEGVFLGGPNVIVEIDAKNFPNVKNKLGHDTWIFGGVDRSTKKCFLEIIHSGEEDEIVRILQKYVLPGTTIISDNWRGFDCLESYGYVHQKVSKSFGFKDPINGAHKNNILCLWGKVKTILGNRIVNDQLDGYLAEIMWRHLHKKETQEVLISFFKATSHIFTPRVRDDPNYISKKIEIGNKRKSCMKMPSASSSSSFSSSEGEDRAQDQEVMVEEKETQLKEMNGNNNEEQGDKLEGENGSQKRQKTMENLDT